MTEAQGVAFFDTAIGLCGIAWSTRGIVGVQLPERSEAATRERLLRRFPAVGEAVPPCAIRQTIDAITALLSGEATDLTAAALDLGIVPQFHQRVYEVARSIPAGSTLSYGEIAARLGDKGLARDVGKAMGKSVADHRSLPSRAGGAWQSRRLFGGRRGDDEAAPAQYRARPAGGGTHAVRRSSAARQARAVPRAPLINASPACP